MSRLSDDLETLASRMAIEAGVQATVSRGGTSLGTFTVIPNASQYEDLGNDGKKVLVKITDFLFQKSDNYTPQKGDLITLANGKKFEVRPLNISRGFVLSGTDVWRIDDQQGSFVICHAQETI